MLEIEGGVRVGVEVRHVHRERNRRDDNQRDDEVVEGRALDQLHAVSTQLATRPEEEEGVVLRVGQLGRDLQRRR